MSLMPPFVVYYIMDKIISIRYEGDDSLAETQKLSILRYVNRVLAGQKDALIASNNAYLRVISKKGKLATIEVIGADAGLFKIITSKIFNSTLPF